MSSAPSRSLPSAEHAFDLDYSIHDFEIDPHSDSQFLFRRIEDAVLREAAAPGARTLDVACGTGKFAVEATRRGGEGWGVDASREMLGLGRWLYPARDAVLLRSLAETLPFRGASFDRIVCQGALDHFVSPGRFMREAARVLRPDGRLVIALANYESLSCRLGRRLHRLAPGERPYWHPPVDHYHKGGLAFVRRLGGRALRLERCYGISLLWLLRGRGDWRWGAWLDGLPRGLARALLMGLDRIAYRTPALADTILSVWRPRGVLDG